MASGSSYAKRRPITREPAQSYSLVPLRATRHLPDVAVEEDAPTVMPVHSTVSKALQMPSPVEKIAIPRVAKVVDQFKPHPLQRHRPWLNRLQLSIIAVVCCAAVLLSAAILQRPGDPQLVNYFGGKSYDVQVGGNNLAHSWQTDGPVSKVPIPAQSGPYSVIGKPTITADFIDQVLASYNSPAAGKGQSLYDLGVKYGIDPTFALAFFLHESTLGTQGEARTTRSLGNLRCIPNHDCVDQDRGGYASFPTWEAGFEAWYQLIRNLYVGTWGRTTVDEIIPKYAPTSDNNNEAGYIASLKHSIDTWHAGALRP